jgi:hypothetical protein
MSHRSNVVVIAGTGIRAQGMGAVVIALKKSHCIEVLDVSCLYWMYAFIHVWMVCIVSIQDMYALHLKADESCSNESNDKRFVLCLKCIF